MLGCDEVMSAESGSEQKYLGYVLGYRRGWNEQYPNQVLLKIFGVETRNEASRFIGAKVVLKDKYGNVYRGKIVGVHGTRGVVRAVFKPNIPGQAIGSTVEIYPSKK